LSGNSFLTPAVFLYTVSFKQYYFQFASETRLGREIAREEAAHPPEESGFHLLPNGLDAFVARAVLAHLAERTIDVQYYLYHDDLVGRLLTWQMLQAADRGVRVRLLVDDMDLAGRDLSAAALDSHPNVEVHIFNPFSRKTGGTSQGVRVRILTNSLASNDVGILPIESQL